MRFRLPEGLLLMVAAGLVALHVTSGSTEPVDTQPPAPVRSAPARGVPAPEAATAAASGLIIPVEGVGRDDLEDTFTHARSEGREHNAIDILAPRGTPVVAVADGRLLRLFLSKPGGKTIYQIATDGQTVYYYAHLDRYEDGLKEGQHLRQGQRIGYVGDTGNATPGNYHLHFAIWTVTDTTWFWDGTNVNPYPLLRGSATR